MTIRAFVLVALAVVASACSGNTLTAPTPVAQPQPGPPVATPPPDPPAPSPNPSSPVVVTSVTLNGQMVNVRASWTEIVLPARADGWRPVPYAFVCAMKERQALRYVCSSRPLTQGNSSTKIAAGSGNWGLELQPWAVERLTSQGINSADGIVVIFSGWIEGVAGNNPELYITDAEINKTGMNIRAEREQAIPLR